MLIMTMTVNTDSNTVHSLFSSWRYNTKQAEAFLLQIIKQYSLSAGVPSLTLGRLCVMRLSN